MFQKLKKVKSKSIENMHVDLGDELVYNILPSLKEEVIVVLEKNATKKDVRH